MASACGQPGGAAACDCRRSNCSARLAQPRRSQLRERGPGRQGPFHRVVGVLLMLGFWSRADDGRHGAVLFRPMPALRDTARRGGLALVGCGSIAWPQAAFAHHVAGHEAGLWRPEWPVAAVLAVSLWFYLAGVRRLWQTASPGRGVSRG